jgi:hypothetical protein
LRNIGVVHDKISAKCSQLKATGRLYEQSSGRTEQEKGEAELFESGDMYVIQYLPAFAMALSTNVAMSDET